MRSRARPALASFCLLAHTLLACADIEPLDQQRSPRGTFGEEAYKAVCRRIAGTDIPTDVAGRRSEAICLGDAATVEQALATQAAELPPRVVALARRRAPIAQAVDDAFAGDLPDQLEHVMRNLLPLYDPPEARAQEATRELGRFLERLLLESSSDPASGSPALIGLARLGRKGMLSREAGLGLTGAFFGASHLNDVARSVLLHALEGPESDPALRAHMDTFLSGLALELATSEIESAPDSDTMRMKRLLLRTNQEFASGRPLFVGLRDLRGMPVPVQVGGNPMPFPFVDADGDGLADVQESRFVTVPEFSLLRLPEPFPIAAEGPAQFGRDGFGRAVAIAPGGAPDPARLLYETTDADPTVLAGVLRAAAKAMRLETLLPNLSYVLGAAVGDYAPASAQYGKFPLAYAAPNPAQSPLLELVHGSTALFDRAIFDDSLSLTERLLKGDAEERAMVAALEPVLALERRTRPDADAYPNAKLKPDHTFWDELLFEVEKLSRRRTSATSESQLAAMARASLGYGRNLEKPGAPVELIADPELLRHQGNVLATLMRFKDEWRANPKGESERAPGEPAMLGGFRTPVDRSQPDSPVTCGRDGCGGLADESPFAAWKMPGQNCVMQRRGRPLTGRDCGAPANQSLLQRSLGLIAEMAGRAVCNRPVTVRELLEFSGVPEVCTGSILPGTQECTAAKAAQTQERMRSTLDAEEAVARDYTCPDSPDAPCRAYADRYPAAYVDPDGLSGPQPATIQRCHMIDVADVGRGFGQAVAHEFLIPLPSPWVRRYLEDIARAGDHNGDGQADLPGCTVEGGFTNYPIVDPTVAPNCVPNAATLSREVNANMPASVDTLGELVEFLLDDSSLFASEQDQADLRPDVHALSRVLFGGAGGVAAMDTNMEVAASSTPGTGLALFDPLLIRGAPPLCADRPELPACALDDTAESPPGGCCIEDLMDAPFRYRLDTYYGATSFAWEQPIRLKDGRTISFYDTIKPMADAVLRYDFDVRRGDDPALFEDQSYAFSTLGKLIAEHYDSAANPLAQASDPNAPHYRRLTGLVTYEALVADALDDGAIDLTQPGPDGNPLFAPGASFGPEQQLGVLYHALPLFQLLDGMEFGAGRDALDVSMEVGEQLLNPHARCAGASGDRRVIAGQGACDRALRGEAGFEPPFRYRDGRDFPCWNDGRCFDGVTQPRRYSAPVYVLLDALGMVSDKVRDDPVRRRAGRYVLSGLLDVFLQTADGRFSDRNARALLLTMLDYTRERVGEERAAGTLSTFGMRADQDALDALLNPVVAGAVGFLSGLADKGSATLDLAHFAASLLSESEPQNNLRPLLAGLFDGLQLLPGSLETNAAARALGDGIVPNIQKAVQEGPGPATALSPQTGVLARNLYLMRETARFDPGNVLERLGQNLVRAPPGRAPPLEVIFDATVDVNRVEPGLALTPTAADLREVFKVMAHVLLDRHRGFERLYAMLVCTIHNEGCDD